MAATVCHTSPSLPAGHLQIGFREGHSTSSTENASAAAVLLKGLKTDLSVFGLDVIAPLCVEWYNQSVEDHSTALKVPTPASAAGGLTLAVLVGNTKNVWAPFLEACRHCPELLQHENPFDTYVEKTIEATVDPELGRTGYKVYWGHRDDSEGLVGGGKRLPLQRVAHASGLAYLDTESHLCLHPKYGSWFGLRCLLVFPSIAYTGPKPAELRNPLCQQTQKYIRLLMTSARNSSQNLARDAAAAEEGPTREQVKGAWRKWVAVRDAPTPGHPWRYCNDQLEYHYTNRRELLAAAVAAQPRH